MYVSTYTYVFVYIHMHTLMCIGKQRHMQSIEATRIALQAPAHR